MTMQKERHQLSLITTVTFSTIALILILGTTSPAFSCLTTKKVSVYESQDAVFEIDSSDCQTSLYYRYKYTTVDDSAVSPFDYRKRTGTLHFSPSSGMLLPLQQKTYVRVTTYDDGSEEESETFKLRLSNLEVQNNDVHRTWVSYDNGIGHLPGTKTFSAEIKDARAFRQQ